MSDPESPQRVRLRYADGSESDVLPVLYCGLDGDGLEVWEAVRPDARRPVAVLVGLLPARSTIRVAMTREEIGGGSDDD